MNVSMEEASAGSGDATTRSLIRPYYPALDGLRGLAILMVFLVHYGNFAVQSRYFGVLWPGVDLFFALSGFLITGILYDSKTTTHYFRNFYIRRSLRIFPLYYGFFLVVALLTPVLRLHYSAALWSHLLYAANIFAWDIGKHNPSWIYSSVFRGHQEGLWLGPLWSLCVEEQFYLIWPLVLWLMPSRQAMMWFSVMAVLGLACLRTVAFLHHPAELLNPGHAMFITYTRCDGLLLGAWLALWLRGVQLSRGEIRKIAYLTMSVSASAILIGELLVGRHWHVPLDSNPIAITYGYSLVGLMAISFLLLALDESSVVHSALRNKRLAALGVVSYGFYFFHGMGAALVNSLNVRIFAPRHLSVLLVLLYFIAIYVLAWLSFRYYESRFLRLKNRWAPGHRSVPSGREDVSPMALVEE
jgi:peptidoglycan/LPS O-acetylase OafA/YrhL